MDSQRETKSAHSERESESVHFEKEPESMDSEREPESMDSEREPESMHSEKEPELVHYEREAESVHSERESDSGNKDVPASEPLDSYLTEQKAEPPELKMMEGDILALTNQAGDEMVESGEIDASLAADLSFLDATEAKEASEGDSDPSLSFLVADGKVEVNNEDLDFLDDQELTEAEMSSDDNDMNCDDDDDTESYSNGEDTEEYEEEEDDKEDEENDKKSAKKDDDAEDYGVFGQVSFYDVDSTSANSLGAQKVKKKKSVLKSKRLTKKRKAQKEDKSASAKKRSKKKKKKEDNCEDDEEEGDDQVLAGTGILRRKNIRSIKSEKEMDKDMLSAQNEELERQKRLMELKKSLLRENAAAASIKVTTASATSTSSSTVATKTASVSTGTSTPKEKDSQLKSLLQVAEEEANEAESKERKQLDKDVVKVKKETRETSPPSDVITLSSDSDDSDDFDDDSDEVVMVPSDEGEDEEDDDDSEDLNNGGAHIDDTVNLPDPDGRVKVNVGHPPNESDIYLAPQIAQAIRPHQIGGVRFLYDNLIESIERFNTTPGFGCVLAHSMGLGKTIQLISFIDIFLRCAGGKRVLCIVPINTLQNWMAEFNYWLPPPEKLHPDDNLTQTRTFPLFVINDSLKTTTARAAIIEKWKETGGVLVLGYEMFRLLSSKKVAPSKAKSSRVKKAVQLEVIDVEEEDKNKGLMIDMHSMLVDPGPDLVVCDEGHRIKNSGAAISQALKNIKTRRRVVLTGYPLQNNLMEYWCMVDFVRPNFLGTKSEFSNMFERPIMNGQCMDSTASDKKIMRHRSYVLHNLLEGFVQRRGHTVLQLSLPPKTEHVFLVRFSSIQRKIYCEFMQAISESGLCSWANNNPLKAFAVCCKIWNHPDILHEVLTQHIADKDNDLDIDTVEGSSNKKKKSLSKSASSASLIQSESAPSIASSASATSLTSMVSESGTDKNPITYDWAEPLMKDYIPGLLENSGKFVLMNSIVEQCLAVGDKVLIFSQSLLTLNKIEEFMGKMKVPRMEINENWQRNKTYFRLDGSTSAQDREKLINQFNDPESNIWVFLLSTKAGCLGINLIAANRVIVIDASWNPCHDCQAICRVYRFGQVKNSYVYRLITDNTLEKRIYDRQINKQGMSDRIVDDMNPENKLTRRQVENLLDFEDQEFPLLDFSNAPTKYGHDQVMLNVLEKHGQWLTKQPFTHESLLIDRKEMRLSKREKRLAKEGYARDKRMNLTYTRPSYAAYYPQVGVLPNRLSLNNRYNYATFRRGPIVRPIASVRPMIIANSQNGGDKIKQFGGQPLRPGVTIQQVITTTDILLPGTNTGTQAGTSPNKITAGQKIFVIKTPKGVYIRTNDGKMFAVRSKSGSGLGDIVSTAVTVSTATTTTLTSAGGKQQIFITPNIAMSSGAGGKKPPIIIVSNKKGMPLTMSRGGSIIRTLPYGSTNLLNSLKPSLLKAGVLKTTDSTTTTSATSTKIFTNISPSLGEKGTSLADLIAGTDDDSKDSEKTTSNGATQSEIKPKMPVIVLPSLAVRTPRPLSSIQSSTVATTSPGGGTVIIMPTKPVVSMGTKRVAKNPRPRKSRAKSGNPVNIVAADVDIKTVGATKKGVSLLTGMNIVTSTNTISTATIGNTTAGTSTADIPSSTGTQAASQAQTSGSTQTPSGTMQISSGTMTTPSGMAHISSGTQIGGISGQKKQKKKPAKPEPPFPDLNSMWQSNFGAGPSSETKAQSSVVPSSTAATTGVAEAGVSSTSNSSYSEVGMLDSKQGRDSTVGGDNSVNINQTLMKGDTQSLNQNLGFPNQYGSNNLGYNNINNPYMPGTVDPYVMDHTSAMGPMDSHMSPYMMSMHPGFMPPAPPGPFSQSLPPPPSQMQSQSEGDRSMMYGSSSTNPTPLFGHSFGPINQQIPPPFESTANEDSSNPSSFGYSSSINYRPNNNSTSFPSQPQSNKGFLQPQASMPFYSSQSSSPHYVMDLPGSHDFSPNQNQSLPSSMPLSSSLTSSASTFPDRGSVSMDKSIPSPVPSPRHATNTPENSKSYMDISNNRPNNSQNSNVSQGFGSTPQSMPGSSSGFSYPGYVSDSNSIGYNMNSANSLSSSLAGYAPVSDIGMGGSAFRAHQGSMPAKPQPFRLDKTSIGSGGSSPGFNYNSGMSAFSSPSVLGGGAGGYGGNSTFGGYGSGYGAPPLPFPSTPVMSSSQNMMGYPQTSLGYPSMSSLMMGSVSPAPPPMGGGMWPMMPPSMMGGGYGYPTHPPGMGFPPGLDGQGFSHLGPGPGDN